MEKTTIQINFNTLNRIKSLKRFERETYDEILNNLINDVEEDVLFDDEIVELQEALEEIRQGKTKSIEEVAKEMQISLI